MARAILIAGNEKRFRADTERFARFLKKKAGLKDVAVIDGYKLGVRKLKKEIQRLLTRDQEGPLLLYYSGHGAKYGWAVWWGGILEYKKLAGLFQNYSGSILFINDCCYAMSAAKALIECKPLRRIGIIAASRSKDRTNASLVSEVLNSWRMGLPYDPASYPQLDIRFGFFGRNHNAKIEEGVWVWWKYRLLKLLRRAGLLSRFLPVPEINITILRDEEDYPVERMRFGAKLDYHFFAPQLSFPFQKLHGLRLITNFS